MKTLVRLSLLTAFTAGLFLQLSHAEEDAVLFLDFRSPIKLEEYQAWVADADFEAIVHRYGWTWTDEMEAWLESNVRTVTVRDYGTHRGVVVPAKGFDQLQGVLVVIVKAYRSAEIEREIQDLTRTQEELATKKSDYEKMVEGLTLDYRQSAAGRPVEVLSNMLNACETARLENDLRIAELEARLDSIRDNLKKEEHIMATTGAQSAGQAAVLRSQLEEQLKNAESDLVRAEEAKQAGALSISEFGAIRRMLEGAKVELAEFDAQSQAVQPSPVYQRLREMLIESETDFAAATRKADFLEKRIREEYVRIEEAMSIYGKLESAKGSLQATIDALAEAGRRLENANQRMEDLQQAELPSFPGGDPKLFG
ncbi:MAG: hypothetical protein AMXMBFR84_08180 [Candidatus Hydrogenedentota bacterium]